MPDADGTDGSVSAFGVSMETNLRKSYPSVRHVNGVINRLFFLLIISWLYLGSSATQFSKISRNKDLNNMIKADTASCFYYYFCIIFYLFSPLVVVRRSGILQKEPNITLHYTSVPTAKITIICNQSYKHCSSSSSKYGHDVFKEHWDMVMCFGGWVENQEGGVCVCVG